jgi:hypothetical protein
MRAKTNSESRRLRHRHNIVLEPHLVITPAISAGLPGMEYGSIEPSTTARAASWPVGWMEAAGTVDEIEEGTAVVAGR